MNTLKAITGTMMAMVIAGVIVLGGWQAGWWFRNQNVNRESHVLRNSYANQQTLRDQITQNIGNVLSISSQVAGVSATSDAAVVLKAQRKAVVNIVCRDAAQVAGDPLDPQQAAFIDANCEAGVISPSSSYN